MAFTKTSGSWWYMDDTPANVTVELHAEKIRPEDVLIATSNTAGKIFCIVFRPVPR